MTIRKKPLIRVKLPVVVIIKKPKPPPPTGPAP
jgi:hypothetical protein